jgi:hypothetical protein
MWNRFFLAPKDATQLGIKRNQSDQHQFPSYILKLRWCLSVCLSVEVSILVQDLDERTGPGLEIEVPRWKRRRTTVCLSVRPTTVPRFNWCGGTGPDSRIWKSGFGKPDSARTVGFGKRDSEKRAARQGRAGQGARQGPSVRLSCRAGQGAGQGPSVRLSCRAGQGAGPCGKGRGQIKSKK